MIEADRFHDPRLAGHICARFGGLRVPPEDVEGTYVREGVPAS
jgi:hypothetical protein